MKKTQAQKDYHRQMKELQQNGTAQKPKKYRKGFRETKLYYYGSRILLIIIIMWLISLFDTAFYDIVNLFR